MLKNMIIAVLAMIVFATFLPVQGQKANSANLVEQIEQPIKIPEGDFKTMCFRGIEYFVEVNPQGYWQPIGPIVNAAGKGTHAGWTRCNQSN